jgi:hypothetical protein
LRIALRDGMAWVPWKAGPRRKWPGAGPRSVWWWVERGAA